MGETICLLSPLIVTTRGVYLLCFLQGGIVFGPPVNDIFSRFICYGSLSPFGRPPGRFPDVLAKDEDGLLVRSHGTAWSCWWLTGFLKRKMHSGGVGRFCGCSSLYHFNK